MPINVIKDAPPARQKEELPNACRITCGSNTAMSIALTPRFPETLNPDEHQRLVREVVAACASLDHHGWQVDIYVGNAKKPKTARKPRAKRGANHGK